MDEKIRKNLQEKLEAQKKQTTIKNEDFEVVNIEKTPFSLIKSNERTLITIGNEVVKELKHQKLTDNIDKILYDENTKTTIFKLDWDLIGPVIYKVATSAAEKVYNELKNK